MSDLAAPFPWFGGKSRVAADVWARFGAVQNYVEPFFGSGAMLLARPDAPTIETVNDKDRFVCNFWRAIQAAPDEVARWCDWPVNEADLSARHLWLITEGAARLARCETDPAYYDAQAAGWWCWGLCSWIGAGWCSGEGPWIAEDGEWINRKLPHLGDAGRGINRKLPHLGAGQGINRQLPHLGDGRGPVYDWFDRLADRLRNVRVCCGDWARVTGPSPTFKHGTTAIFLDPPYADTAGRSDNLYAQDSLSVAHEVREWAIANGDNPLLRIALCGYDGEHVMPAAWTAWAWKATGGYGNQGTGAGRDNAAREVIWFSPHCLGVVAEQADMFAVVA